MAEAKKPVDLIAYADNMLFARQVVLLLEARRPKGTHRTQICNDGQSVSVLSDDEGIHTVRINIHTASYIGSKRALCATEFSAPPVGQLSAELIQQLYVINAMNNKRMHWCPSGGLVFTAVGRP